MLRKYGLNLIAVIIAVSAAAFTAPSKEASPKANFYYVFMGTPGQESQPSKWSQLSTIGDYNAYNCPLGSNKGCKIVNTSNSGGHPTSVPLDGSGLPTPTSPNVTVANRN